MVWDRVLSDIEAVFYGVYGAAEARRWHYVSARYSWGGRPSETLAGGGDLVEVDTRRVKFKSHFSTTFSPMVIIKTGVVSHG